MATFASFEIQADDPERAVAFYEAVADWQFEALPGDMPYWLIHTGAEDGVVGGLQPRPGPVDGTAVIAFVCTLAVDDLEAALAKVRAAGGEVVVAPMSLPGVGRRAYLKDSEGNVFGMQEPEFASTSGR